MYDTVSAVLSVVPPEVTNRRRWDTVRDVVQMGTGEVSRRATINTRDGLLLTLYQDGRALQAERSLPKLYRGQNIDDLVGPAVGVAVGMLDAEIADALGYWDLPSFAEWMPVRVDYPRSIRLGDDAAVLRTLDKYAGVALPYKGLPVVGQSQSVTWSKGDIKVKAYSKFLESQDPRAHGLLRVEPGVFRLRTFRRLLGRESDEGVTVLDVLSPVLHAAVHDRFDARLRGDVMSAKELRDMDLLREMVAVFGARRTATLLGWALMWGLTGAQSREAMLAVSLGTMRTRYRVLADYRRLRDELTAKGYVLSETGAEDDDVEALVHLIAEAA